MICSQVGKSAPYCRAKKSKLLEPPEGTISVKAYSNTDFVNILIKKCFYEKIIEKVRELDVTPDIIICNALCAQGCLENG